MNQVVIALLRQGDRWFLQRRDPGQPVLPELWEFPGGKVEAGEAPVEALRRELREEVAVTLREARLLPGWEAGGALTPFLVSVEGLPETALAWGWFTPREALRMPIPPANRALLARLAEGDLLG